MHLVGFIIRMISSSLSKLLSQNFKVLFLFLVYKNVMYILSYWLNFSAETFWIKPVNFDLIFAKVLCDIWQCVWRMDSHTTTEFWKKPLQPSGHYMYRQFNIQQFYVLPTHCICVFCVDLRTNSNISLYNINWLGFNRVRKISKNDY